MKRHLAPLALAFALVAPVAHGQGCSMCATSAEATDQQGRRALSRGVMVLLIPPVGIMALLVGAAFRYRNHPDDER
ncbi:MAG: hypothetical protein ACRD2R_07850 [Terriglobales bacterium]